MLRQKFIPDDEKWLYRRQNIATLENAIQCSENNERRDNFDEIKILSAGWKEVFYSLSIIPNNDFLQSRDDIEPQERKCFK